MKLHLPFGLRKAVMACLAAFALPVTLSFTVSSGVAVAGGAAIVSLVASQQASAAITTEHTTLSVDDSGVEYVFSGRVFTLSGTSPISDYNAYYTQYAPTDGSTKPAGGYLSVAGQNTTMMPELGTGKFYLTFSVGTRIYGHTMRLDENSLPSLTFDFSPLALGGMWVEGGDHTITSGNTGASRVIRLEAAEGCDVEFIIKSNLTFDYYRSSTTAGAATQVEVHSNTNWRVADGTSFTIKRDVTTLNDSCINIVNLSGSGTGTVVFDQKLDLNGESVLTVGKGTTLEAHGNISLSQAIQNEGNIVLADGITLQANIFERQITSESILFSATVFEGSGTVQGLSGVSVIFGSGSSISDVTWNGGVASYEQDFKTVTTPTLDWRDRTPIDSEGNVYIEGDGLRFVTDTVANLVEDIHAAAVYVAEGASLTLQTAPNTNKRLSTALAIFLDGDLVLTKTNLLAADTEISALSPSGRVVVDVGDTTEIDTNGMFGTNSGYTGTVVVRSGRLRANSASLLYDDIIVEDGGQFYTNSSYAGDVHIAGDGYYQNQDSKAADKYGALRLDDNAHLTGDLYLTDDATVIVYTNTGYIDGNVYANNHTLAYSCWSATMVINGEVFDLHSFDVRKGTLKLTRDWVGDIHKSGGGTLTLDGFVSGMQEAHVEAGELKLSGENGSKLEGSGTLTKTGAGTLRINSEVAHTGKLVIEGGTVHFGVNQDDTKLLSFSEIELQQDTTLVIAHSLKQVSPSTGSTSFSGSNITLLGGTMEMLDANGTGNDADAAIYFGDLVVDAPENTMRFVYNGGLGFTSLSGNGNINLLKTQGSSEPGYSKELSSLRLDEIHNYNGTIRWSEAQTNIERKDYHSLYIGAVHQDAGYDATMELMAHSELFHKTGEGTLTLEGGLIASKDLWMSYEGTLNVNGPMTLERNTVLHYDGDQILQITDEAGEKDWIQASNIGDGHQLLYIYAYDLSAEALQAGVKLGLGESIDSSLISVIGFKDGDYELSLRDDGSWYLTADAESRIDPTGTDGLWDAAWGQELALRPLGNIPTAAGTDFEAHPDSSVGGAASKSLWLARNDKFHVREGAAEWVRLTAATTAAADSLYVFGGNTNSTNNGATTAEDATLVTDVWIDIEGGKYAAVAGGFDMRDGSDNPRATSFNGNVHIIQQEGSVERLVGGSYGTGHDSTFTGDTYISVFGGSVGSITGGSIQYTPDCNVSNSTRVPTFIGDSHIYIYALLSKPAGSDSLATDYIAGGNAHLETTANATSRFTGNSNILIDMDDRYATRRNSTFSKRIVGGSVVTGINGILEQQGDTSIIIRGTEGVTFTERIIGGSYDDGGSKSTIYGSTSVSIDGGIFDSMIVAGSNQGVLDADSTGRSDNLQQDPNLTISGDTQLTILSGEFRGYDSTLGTAREDVENHSIGNVALVGGNYHAETGNISANCMEFSTIGGSTSVSIAGGTFKGHIVGASALEGLPTTNALNYFHTSLTVGSSSVVMLGGEMVKTPGDSEVDPADWVPRLVGGFLVHSAATYRTAGNDQSDVTIGDISVTIAGDASVYDVVGGSWTPCLDAPNVLKTKWQGMRVTQGNITVTLGGDATVRGDVYAGGIQGGTAGIQSESTSVSIGSGVIFDKWNGSATIVSGGYLATSKVNNGTADEPEWEEIGDAYGSPYTADETTEHSEIAGSRTLTFSDAADYGNNLANVRLLNFDEVTLQDGTKVTVDSLLITDAGVEGENDTITVLGNGTLSMKGSLLEVTDYDAEEKNATKQIFNNSALVVKEGTALNILNSGEVGTTYIDHIVIEKGSLTLNMTNNTLNSNDQVLVADSIEVQAGNTLNINIRVADNLTAGLDAPALITRYITDEEPEDAPVLPDDEPAPAAETVQLPPTLVISGAKVNILFTDIDLPADGGKRLNFVLADAVQRDIDTTFNTACNGSLYKWFGNSAKLQVLDDEASGLEKIVFTGVVVTPDTADFHRRNAISANGYAGALLMDALYSTVNPERNAPGSDRANLLSGLEAMLGAENYAEADRTMAAAAGASLSTLGVALSDDVERQLRAIRNRTTTMGGSYDPEEEGVQVSFWLNAEGDYRKMAADDTLPGYKLNSWGGTVGASSDVTPNTTIGLAISAMYGDFEADAPDKAKGDMNTSYISAFARTASGAWSHTFIATAGIASVDVKRTVTHALGSYSTQASTDGFAMGLMYELGYSILLNEQGTSCLQPVLNVSWRHSKLDAFSESGSDAGLQVDAQTYNTFVIGGGARIQTLMGANTINRSAILEARALAKGYFGDDAGSATVSYADVPRSTTTHAKETGKFGVELGAGVTLPTTSRGTNALFLDASVELRDAYTNFNATIGWKASF